MRRLPLYADVADAIGRQILAGVYAPGERLPSIRELSRRMNVSITTVTTAYAELENRALVQARPQSGYFVRPRPPEPRRAPGCDAASVAEDVREAVSRALESDVLILPGRITPNPRLLPSSRLASMLAVQVRRHPDAAITYAPTRGIERLRAEIAKRSVDFGCALSPDDIVVTSGCSEAITLALRAICRPGDTVAVGVPVHVSTLAMLRAMSLRVLEIPSNPQDGVSLDVLDFVVRNDRPAACLVAANFNNPLGYTLSEDHKRALVELLARHEIPLIEDDVFGDLAFAATRPAALKTYDRTGGVVLCSSFSKTLAPGFRIGWTAAGRFQARLDRCKSLHDIAASAPAQLALAEFLACGGYDRHLRAMRRAHAHQMARMRECVARHFPAGTRVTDPQGGFTLWVEVPDGVDTLALHREGLRRGLGVAPGLLFSLGNACGSGFRLNAAFWTVEVERALAALGDWARTKPDGYDGWPVSEQC